MALSSAFAKTLNLSTSSFTGSKLSGSPVSVPTVARPQQTPQIVAKQLQGKVIQNVCDKTASIAVTRIYEHPRYKKRLRKVKKYPAHDPENLVSCVSALVMVSSVVAVWLGSRVANSLCWQAGGYIVEATQSTWANPTALQAKCASLTLLCAIT